MHFLFAVILKQIKIILCTPTCFDPHGTILREFFLCLAKTIYMAFHLDVCAVNVGSIWTVTMQIPVG
jgi:hypothetical protein